MKKFFSIIFILISFQIISQELELDENYLKSLPEDVREDLEERIEEQKESEQPVYRSASSRLDKELDDLKKTGVFGEKFFDTLQSTFMPINEPNLDDSYVLDFGDVLEIQIIGQQNSIESYAIKRDGSINIPEIGRIIMSGLTLKDASSLLKGRVKNAYIGTEAFLSLENIRDVNVLITGNAFNPGIYTLNGSSNILHALSMAGGIDEGGSYREIRLIRNNEVVYELDLYDLFIFGKSNTTLRLKSGDSIVVSPTKNIVNVISGVKRVSYYELKDGETFRDLINFANGFSSKANLDDIRIERVVKDKIKTLNVSSNELNEIEVNNNDALIIPEYKYGSVSLKGAIRYPGDYLIKEGQTLMNVIERAGGYESYAYPFGGYLNNLRSLEINKDAKERIYDSILTKVISGTSASPIAATSLPYVLEELRKSEDTGRVIAEFDVDVIKANPHLDTILEDGDEIIIPSITQQVYVYGQVSNTGAIRYSQNESISYYVDSSGGVLPGGDSDSIFVVHPNGETQNISLRVNKGRTKFFNLNNEIPVYPGSIIYVPGYADASNQLQVASLWAPIISSLALSVASVASLSNN